MTSNSLIYIVRQLLYKNSIAFDNQELTLQIQSHPSYPSLHAITGVLDHFNIENIAASVNTDNATIQHLPNTFIAQLQTENGSALATIIRQKSTFKAVIAENTVITLNRSEFLDQFTGIILAVEKGTDVIKTNSAHWLNRIAWALPLILLLALYAGSNPTLFSIISLVLSSLGIVISSAIIKQELGLNNAIGNAFCASANEKKDCDAVLSSDSALIFGRFKISNLSITYFVTFALVNLLFSIQGLKTNFLPYLSFLSLSAIFYSIYYQWVVIKKWCLLCLSIVAILVIHAGVSLFIFETIVASITLNTFLIFISAALAVYMITIYV